MTVVASVVKIPLETKKIEKCTDRGDMLEANVNFPTKKR